MQDQTTGTLSKAWKRLTRPSDQMSERIETPRWPTPAPGEPVAEVTYEGETLRPGDPRLDGWYHTIELAPGLVTRAVYDHRPIVDRRRMLRMGYRPCRSTWSIISGVEWDDAWSDRMGFLGRAAARRPSPPAARSFERGGDARLHG